MWIHRMPGGGLIPMRWVISRRLNGHIATVESTGARPITELSAYHWAVAAAAGETEFRSAKEEAATGRIVNCCFVCFR